MLRVTLKYGLGMLLMMAASPADAQTSRRTEDKAAAELLFQEGRRLLKEQDYRAACEKLSESQRLDPAVGTLLYLAECHERRGATASAWATFHSAASAARAAGQIDRQKLAQDKADALEPKLSRIAVTVGPEVVAMGAMVQRNGSGVGRASWGIGVPVDPGEHVVTVTAPGRKPWTTTVQVRDGESRSVEVPLLESQTPVATSSTASGPLASGPRPVSSHGGAAVNRRGNPQRTLGLVASGVGVGSLALGAFFGFRSRSLESDSESYCRQTDLSRCSQKGMDLLAEGRSAATLANIGLIAGGAVLATGAVVYLTAPRGAGRETGGVSVELWSVPTLSGPEAVMRGTW